VFCPQCKAEYRAGFRCADCDVDLVDHIAVKQHTRDPFAPEPDSLRVPPGSFVIDKNSFWR
jgi:hypothetical protein